MLKVVGEVSLLPNGIGIQMELPPQSGDPQNFHKIVYGQTNSGKRYIETQSLENGNWPVFGEASIPEILTLARKAIKDLPTSRYTAELYAFTLRPQEALDETS